MKRLIPILVALAVVAGCTAQLRKLGIESQDCAFVDIAVSTFIPAEQAKCLVAPNPATDEHCLAVTGMRLASAQCKAAVATNTPVLVESAVATLNAATEPVEDELPPIPQ